MLAINGYHADNGSVMRQGRKEAYDILELELELEYGDWHGFDEVFVSKFGSH